jgi:hypothetical protein
MKRYVPSAWRRLPLPRTLVGRSNVSILTSSSSGIGAARK